MNIIDFCKDNYTKRAGGLSKRNKKEVKEIKDLTSFLPSTAYLKTRMWHIINNINSVPLCKTCKKNEVKWHDAKHEYRKYCHIKCRNRCPDLKKQAIETNLKNFGVENPFQNEDIKTKIKKTLLKTRGVEHISQDPVHQEQKRSNYLKKYGVEYPNQNPIVKEKKKQTNLKKYGVEYSLQDNEVRKKIDQTNIEKYGYINPFQNEQIKEKIKQTNLEKYGVKNPSQNKKIQDKKKKTCLKLYERDYYNQKDIPLSTLKLLNDKNWLYTQHYTEKKSLLHISKELNLGPSMSTVSKYLHRHGLETQFYFRSQGEKEVYEFIKYILPNTEILHNKQNIIGQELDIYVPGYNIAIEYNGLYYHSSAFKKSDYHLNKTLLCKAKGIQLLHIYSDEWEFQQHIVKTKLRQIFNKSIEEKIYARKTTVKCIDKKTLDIFLNATHIQGSGSGSIKLALEYDNNIVGAICFIKRKDNIYELNRYSTGPNVIGGFSKLLKYFIRNYNPIKIISFADRRWSNGDMYIKNNFKLDKITKPDYAYVTGTTYKKRKHKFNFRHKQLKLLLKEYDPNLTEIQNTENHGLHRIYNCGLLKYIMEI